MFLLSLAHVLVCGGVEEQWWWYLPEQCPHQGKSNDRSQSLVKVIAATIGLPFCPCSLKLGHIGFVTMLCISTVCCSCKGFWRGSSNGLAGVWFL